MSEQTYDVVVIGGGPGGYVAAIRAAQLGLKTACIDKWVNTDGSEAFGGTCLNAGCIPSKALLESSEAYEKLGHEYEAHGITVSDAQIDLEKMMSRKTEICRDLTGGIDQLFNANGVEGLKGLGRLIAKDQVEFTSHDGDTRVLNAKHVILAAGSEPINIPVAPINGETIVDSWGALEFDAVPERLGVIGAGVIGLELGSVWRRLGSEVTVLEAMDKFLSIADQTIARDAARQFKKQGLKIELGARVTGSEVTDEGVVVSYEQKGETLTATYDKVIVCVGRRPYTENLFSAEAEVLLDERGFVEIDKEFRSSIPGVFAIGDLVRGPMLAHKAMEEGVAVAEIISGKPGHVNYDVIPSVIYTHPELAWVGKTEQELKDAGVDYKVGGNPFAANGRAKAMEAGAGQVKMLADAATDEILGVHIVGPMASELIAECVLAMEYQASAEDISRTMHAHPTLAEALHEAALSVDKRAIHAINR